MSCKNCCYDEVDCSACRGLRAAIRLEMLREARKRVIRRFCELEWSDAIQEIGDEFDRLIAEEEAKSTHGT